MITIVSKRTTPIEIIEHEYDAGRQMYIKIRSITIAGGAGILNPKTLITPNGVTTEVTEEDYKWLKTQAKFNKLVEAGIFRVVEGRARTIDADAIADSGKMEKNENIPGRPLTPEMLEKDGAVINKDGSVNMTNGGERAGAEQIQRLDELRRTKRIAARRKDK